MTKSLKRPGGRGRGEPAADVFPIAVGMSRLYACAGPDKLGADETVTAADSTFHLGIRR